MTNLSQWFDLAEQKPWEVGVYEFKAIDRWGDPLKRPYYSWWDGKEFHGGWDDPVMAYENKSYTEIGFYSATHWRGLSTNPEVKKKTGNRRVTKHIVMQGSGAIKEPIAVFDCPKMAKDRVKWMEENFFLWQGYVKTIRFRTPE